MKQVTVFLSALAALALVAGCGDDKPNRPPLTAAQKSEFKDATVATSRSLSVASASAANQSKARRTSPLMTLGDFVQFGSGHEGTALAASGSSSSYDRNHEAMTRELQRSFDSAECKASYTELPIDKNNLANNVSGKFGYEIVGERCPLVSRALVSMQASGDRNGARGEVGLDLSYRVQTSLPSAAALLTYNDIIELALKGSLKYQVEDAHNNPKVDLDFDISGKATAQKSKSIEYTFKGKITGSQDNIDMNLSMVYQFPTFAAELKVVGSGNSQKADVKYYLNSEELTQKEFSEWLQTAVPVSKEYVPSNL